jgi:hypothetical protein
MAMTEEQREQRRKENQEAQRRKRDEVKRERQQAAHDRIDRILQETDEPLEGGELGRHDIRDHNAVVPSLRSRHTPVFGDHKNTPITAAEKELFLQEYAKSGLIIHSAHATGRSYKSFQRLRKEDPAFEEMVRYAAEVFNESLSGEIIRRGRDGILKPVFSPALGVEIGVTREYDQRLLEVEAKRRMPEQYRENISMKVDDNRPHVLIIERPAATGEEWEQRRDQYLQEKEEQRRLASQSGSAGPKLPEA